MISTGFLIRSVVGASVVLTYFSRQLRPLPIQRGLPGVTLLVLGFIFWLGVGTWATRTEKILVLQNSWAGLQAISKLEFCEEKPRVKRSIGKAAAEFGRLKQALDGLVRGDAPQALEQAVQTAKTANKTNETECKGRLAEEPWLHFRYRLALGQLNEARAAWSQLSTPQSEHSPFFVRFFKAYLKSCSKDVASVGDLLKVHLAHFAEWSWVLLQTGEKQTSFHQLWIENFIDDAKRPTSADLALELISSEAPDWRFVQQLAQFLLPEPERWKTDPVAPALLRLPERGFCAKVAKDPTLTPQTKSVWKHLRLLYEGCERRWTELGKLPGECNPAKIRKALTIVCIEKNPTVQAGQLPVGFSTPLQWPGLPSSLFLATQTLVIPDNYLEGDAVILPYRAYRLAYSIEHIFFDTLLDALVDPQVPWVESSGVKEDFNRPHLLTAPAFELTRLEMLKTMSPFGPQELAPELQAYFGYDRFGARLERFQEKFNTRLHKLKGELE